MKRFLQMLWPAIGVGALVYVAGCGTPQQGGETGTNEGGSGNATTGAGGSASGGKQLRVAVIPKGLAHVFWKSVRRGAEDAGQKYNAQIIWNGPSSEAEVSRQVQITEDAITQKVDGIVLAPIDRKALVGAIDKASKAEIPVAIFDSDADTKNRISFVATDNYKGGVLAARRAGKVAGGKGKVGMVPVQPNSQSTGDRERGFEDTIRKEFPNMKVVRSNYGYSDREKSLRAAEDMLTKDRDLVAVFGPNESSVVGALGALRNRKLIGKVKLVGFDAADILVEALKSGDIDSLVLQNPYKMGYEGVKAVADHLAKQRVAPRIDTGVVLVTKDNMDTPQNQELLALK